VTAEHERRGALEALDRVLNRGGDADDVLRDVVRVLFELYAFVGIDFIEQGAVVSGPSLGERPDDATVLPVAFEAANVANLVVAWPHPEEDRAFLERVALLISPYCLVGWDTGGERWEP
jgi:hypothetical protein